MYICVYSLELRKLMQEKNNSEICIDYMVRSGLKTTLAFRFHRGRHAVLHVKDALPPQSPEATLNKESEPKLPLEFSQMPDIPQTDILGT